METLFQEAERNRALQYGEDAAGTLHKQNGTLIAAQTAQPAPALSLQTALVKGKVKLALYYKVKPVTVKFRSDSVQSDDDGNARCRT